MSRLIRHVRGNAVAYLALLVALSGTSYAATSLGPGTVGGRQIKNHSITPIKFAAPIAGYVRHWIHVSAAGRIIGSSGGAEVTYSAGEYQITWRIQGSIGSVPGRCSPLVTIDNNEGSPLPLPGNVEPASGADASVARGPGARTTVFVTTFNGLNQAAPGPFYLVLVCS